MIPLRVKIHSAWNPCVQTHDSIQYYGIICCEKGSTQRGIVLLRMRWAGCPIGPVWQVEKKTTRSRKQRDQVGQGRFETVVNQKKGLGILVVESEEETGRRDGENVEAVHQRQWPCARNRCVG